jgi:hypothetical protein
MAAASSPSVLPWTLPLLYTTTQTAGKEWTGVCFSFSTTYVTNRWHSERNKITYTFNMQTFSVGINKNKMYYIYKKGNLGSPTLFMLALGFSHFFSFRGYRYLKEMERLL